MAGLKSETMVDRLSCLSEYLPKEHLLQFCLPHLLELCDVDALIDFVTEKRLTYRQLLERAVQLAAWLVQQRTQTEEHTGNDRFVQIYGDNSIDWFTCMYGTWLSSAGVATASTQWTKDRFCTYVNRVAAATMVVDVSALRNSDDTNGIIHSINNSKVRNIILINDHDNNSDEEILSKFECRSVISLNQIFEQQTFDDALAFLLQNRSKIFFEQSPTTSTKSEEDYGERIASLTPSTGTTGVPKSIIITHNVQVARWTFTQKNVASRPIPTTPTTPFTLLLNPVASMTGMVYEHFNSYAINVPRRPTGIIIPIGRRFDLHCMGRAIERYRIKTMLCPVQMLTRCFLDAEFNTRYDLSSIDYCLTGAWPLKAAMHKRICQVQNWPLTSIQQLYGSSEAGIMIVTIGLTPEQQREKVGSIGIQPTNCAYDVKIFELDDENNKTLTQPNERGEMLVRTKAEYSGNNNLNPMFRGYYGDEQKTREAFSDGWYRTGDVCYRDEDDVYWHVERTAELVWMSHAQQQWYAPAELEPTIVLRLEREIVDVALVPQNKRRSTAGEMGDNEDVLDHLVAFVEPRISWVKQRNAISNKSFVTSTTPKKFRWHLSEEDENDLKIRICSTFNGRLRSNFWPDCFSVRTLNANDLVPLTRIQRVSQTIACI